MLMSFAMLQRPSATECLEHPWIQLSDDLDAAPLDPTVLQRLQRFSQNGVFKCTVLEHIGRELVTMHFGPEDKKSGHAEAVFTERSVRRGQVCNAMMMTSKSKCVAYLLTQTSLCEYSILIQSVTVVCCLRALNIPGALVVYSTN